MSSGSDKIMAAASDVFFGAEDSEKENVVSLLF